MELINLKKITLAITFALLNMIGYSQSHDYKPWCRYSKSNVTADGTCPACKKDRDDEKEAIQKEAQREKERIAQEAVKKAEAIRKSAEELARKNEEARKEREKNIVYIGAPKPTSTESPSKIGQGNKGKTIIGNKSSNTLSVLTSKTERINDEKWSIITDNQNNLLFKTTEYEALNWDKSNRRLFLNDAPADFPKNILIVKDNITSKMNLVNAKGKKILTEEDISYVFYCGSNFFMYFICNSNEKNCYEGSTSIAGDIMVLYDKELDKKYLYKKNGDRNNCTLNSRYQIHREAKLSSDEALFSFMHPVCTHQEDGGGWVLSNTENIGVGKNRKPFLIGISQDKYMGH